MTPLDIRPLPVKDPPVVQGRAVVETCGYVDDAVIEALLSGRGLPVPVASRTHEDDGRAWADPPFGVVLAH